MAFKYATQQEPAGQTGPQAPRPPSQPMQLLLALIALMGELKRNVAHACRKDLRFPSEKKPALTPPREPLKSSSSSSSLPCDLPGDGDEWSHFQAEPVLARTVATLLPGDTAGLSAFPLRPPGNSHPGWHHPGHHCSYWSGHRDRDRPRKENVGQVLVSAQMGGDWGARWSPGSVLPNSCVCGGEGVVREAALPIST